MRDKTASIKLLGAAVTILGFGLTIFTNWVEDKALNERIKQGIDDEFARRNLEEES